MPCAGLLLEVLALGYDPNTGNAENGYSPATAAVMAGRADTLDALLDAGAIITLRDPRGVTPVLAAASRGHTRCLQVALAAAKAAGLHEPCLDESLASAALEGHVGAMRMLIAAGASLTSVPPEARHHWRLPPTPLIAAAAGGHLEALQLLLSYPAARATVNAGGEENALAAAASSRNFAGMWLLHQHGARPAPGCRGMVSMVLGACSRGDDEMLAALMACGFNVAAWGASGNFAATMATTAAALGHERVLRLLLDDGALPCSSGGAVPLLSAVQEGRWGTLCMLLDEPRVLNWRMVSWTLMAYCTVRCQVDRAVLRRLVMVSGG